MHYPDEPYVRFYTRKTLTNRLLGWEGRAVLQAMLGGDEFDRAGIFNLQGDPVLCIATVTELPHEIVRIGLERLLKTKTWTLTDDAIVWPAYVEAQTCARSDKTRQQESRTRRAANATRGGNGHEPSRPVTPSHAESQPSQNVTLSLAELSLAEPISSERARESDGGREPESEPEPEPEPSASPREGAKHPSYPEGWRWSLKTTAEAEARGLTAADLQGHVNYWTVRDFAGGAVTDLDGELRRSLEGIASRKAKATGSIAAGATEPIDRYAWAPTGEHRAFAKERGRDLRIAVDAYRAARMPEKAPSTLRAHEDFMRRLRWWADNGGEFPATGKLPRQRPSAPEAAAACKAVGA